MAMTPMRKIWSFRGLQFFWAGRKHRFEYPGLYVWVFRRNVRILPLPKKRYK